MEVSDYMKLSINKSKQLRPNLLNVFPRVMGMPSVRKIVYNSKERDEYIREWGTSHPIYMSVYAFTKVNEYDLFETHQHAKVSHMVCDLDEGNTYEEMMRMHKWLSEKDIIHRIHLSGRGFHEYFWIKENLNFPKVAIANYWDFLKGDKNGEYHNPFKPDKEYISPRFAICQSTRGDLGRIMRYPNSYHYGMECFCIVIDQYLLYRFHSIDEFRRFAKKPYKPRQHIYYGNKKLDISEFDCTPEQYSEIGGSLKLSYITYGDIEINHDIEFDIEDIPYCIKYMIDNQQLHFAQRNEVIKFLFNRTDTLIPYDPADVMGILLKISERNKWLRWFFRHHREDILYRNVRVVHDNIEVLSGCNKIKKMGYCNRDFCKWKTITVKK